jgi:hypothetical protein
MALHQGEYGCWTEELTSAKRKLAEVQVLLNVRVAGALLSIPARPPLEHRILCCLVSTGSLVLCQGDHLAAGDDYNVGQAEGPQHVPEVRAASVDLIRGGPQHPNRGCSEALQPINGQL